MKKLFISILSLTLFIPTLTGDGAVAADLTNDKNFDKLFNAPVEISTDINIDQKTKEVFISENNNDQCTINADISSIPEEYKGKLIDTAKLIGCEKLASLKSIEIINDENMPRALAGRYTLKLRSDVFKKPEFENLLIHEFGHIIDLGYLKGTSKSGKSNFKDGSLPIYKNDISVDFYSISWVDSVNIKDGTNNLDFVTGYAMTDPFEDFAESLLYYIKHNREFKILSQDNDILKAKYEFIKNSIFNGEVFETGNSFAEKEKREWDATKIF